MRSGLDLQHAQKNSKTFDATALHPWFLVAGFSSLEFMSCSSTQLLLSSRDSLWGRVSGFWITGVLCSWRSTGPQLWQGLLSWSCQDVNVPMVTPWTYAAWEASLSPAAAAPHRGGSGVPPQANMVSWNARVWPRRAEPSCMLDGYHCMLWKCMIVPDHLSRKHSIIISYITCRWSCSELGLSLSLHSKLRTLIQCFNANNK